MKVLKKKNKYEKVEPLPRGYISLILARKLKEINNKYRKSYEKIINLLEDGYRFASRESYRENQAKNQAKKKPTKKKNLKK